MVLYHRIYTHFKSPKEARFLGGETGFQGIHCVQFIMRCVRVDFANKLGNFGPMGLRTTKISQFGKTGAQCKSK